MFLIFIISCVHKTSTPKEFINNYIIQKEFYKKDLTLLSNAVEVHYDSINNIVNPHHVTKILNVKIDTIFYGNDHKIVFLALLTNKNEYAEKGIQYAGECYIAYKKNEIENLYQLKYSSTSTISLKEVSQMLRENYLQEMNYIEGRYNINDTRFWNSNVWKEAKEVKENRKNFEEIKKNNPSNVYDPNERK